MKEMDRLTIESFGIPGIVLMESAGRGCVDAVIRHFPAIGQMKVGIAAGRGNNGGDGFVIARYLATRDIDVTVYLLSARDRIRGDAAFNLQLIDRLGVPVFEVPDINAFEACRNQMTRCNLWIDALLGTGLKSEVRGPFKPCIEWLNEQQAPVVAVDIPSGLDSDTGKPCGCCTRAALTVTFAFPKIGQVVLPGAEFVGRLEVVDIGIPPTVVGQVSPHHRLLSCHDVKRAFKPRRLECHKGSAGHLLVIGSSPGKTGAVAMTSQAAMRVGAGLVTVGVPKSLNLAMESLLTEVMTVPLPENKEHSLGLSAFEKIMRLLEGKKGLAIGPGLGTGKPTQNLVRRVIEASPVPVVVDADGLNALVGETASLKNLKVPVVMTPHPGEMARLVGKTAASIQENRIGESRRFATKNRVHLVLKGARTLIAHPDGFVAINPTGNPGMASGGMGDVLTGMIAGLVVQGMGVPQATEAAVYLHGKAADALAGARGPVGYLASEVSEILPEQTKALWKASDEQRIFDNSLITSL
jgi:NAD(P)H-hydrate epimerase